jgi:short-subunit dehydrogenase
MPTALITGPTAGIGRAFATAYARRGFDLLLVSRDAARLGQVAKRLDTEYGVSAQVFPTDLADRDALERVAGRLQDPQRPVDALVNNAGFGLAKWFGDTSFEEEERSLDVLVRAPLRLSHAAVKQMQQRGRGEILNVSSVSGYMPRGTYGAHKAWLISFTEWMSLAYRDKGLRITVLCPGFVRTEFHRRGNMDTSKVREWMWLDAEAVVAHALRDLRAGKAISIPTRRYQAMSLVGRLAPRGVVARIARIGR